MKSLFVSFVSILLLAFPLIGRAQTILILNDVDQTWVAGTTHGVKYYAQGLVGQELYVDLLNNDGSGYHMTVVYGEPIVADGNDATAFKIPFWLAPGEYNIALTTTVPGTEKAFFYFQGKGVITVASPIISPSAGDRFMLNHPLTVRFVAEEGVGPFRVYLVNSGALPVAWVNIAPTQREITFMVPKSIAAGVYSIAITTGDNMKAGAWSDPFTIVHDNRNKKR